MGDSTEIPLSTERKPITTQCGFPSSDSSRRSSSRLAKQPIGNSLSPPSIKVVPSLSQVVVKPVETSHTPKPTPANKQRVESLERSVIGFPEQRLIGSNKTSTLDGTERLSKQSGLFGKECCHTLLKLPIQRCSFSGFSEPGSNFVTRLL